MLSTLSAEDPALCTGAPSGSLKQWRVDQGGRSGAATRATTTCGEQSQADFNTSIRRHPDAMPTAARGDCAKKAPPLSGTFLPPPTKSTQPFGQESGRQKGSP